MLALPMEKTIASIIPERKMNNLQQGDRLELRALEPSDLDILYRWENDTEIWDISDTLSPISKHILKIYLENSAKDIYENKQERFIIQMKEASIPIGTIDLFQFDPFHNRAGVGILIAEKNDRQKGFALEALHILKDYCFNILKLHQLWCNVSVNNQASIQLFQKAGFEISCTRKSWNWDGEKYLDEYFLQCFI